MPTKKKNLKSKKDIKDLKEELQPVVDPTEVQDDMLVHDPPTEDSKQLSEQLTYS